MTPARLSAPGGRRPRRELQQRSLTYAVVGRGTFAHPWPPNASTPTPTVSTLPEAPLLTTADPDLNRRVAQFLLRQSRSPAGLSRS